MNKIYETLGTISILAVTGIYTVFVWFKLIEWILVPIFGIRQLSMIELYCLFVVYANFTSTPKEPEFNKITFTNRIVSNFIKSTLGLVFGYFASRFL